MISSTVLPLWFIMLIPMSWILVIPIVLLLNSGIFLAGLLWVHYEHIKKAYKMNIWKIALFGFAVDLLGCLILAGTQLIFEEGSWWVNTIAIPVGENCFTNIFAFLAVTAVVALCGLLIYWFNMKISLRKLSCKVEEKKKIAILLAVCTAPYVLYFPGNWLYT